MHVRYLEQPMNRFLYQGNRTNQISFPLGGLGTGCIGLAGNGRLIDWEIFNRPNKGSVNGFSHFAVKAESEGKLLDARVLHGDLKPPYQGEMNAPQFNSFGWGPRREYLTGMPHFRNIDFLGEFPLAKLTYHHELFPGDVRLRAFNPLIPLNDKDSGIPAALFEFRITNDTENSIDYTLTGVLSNPLPANNVNTVSREAWGHHLHLSSDGVGADATAYGDLTLATDAEAVSWQQYWFRGAWFDALEVYWKDLTTPGRFKNRTYTPEQAGEANEGLLAAHVNVEPGETQTVRFVISWNFPNCENYWKEVDTANCDGTDECCCDDGSIGPTWRNYYATLWKDSLASSRYVLENWDRLAEETDRFKQALFASDLPPAALDAVSANISILKSPTVLRLEDGTFYGWEGCHPTAGCCEGSCTHVWNYAQALPFLFPKLERSMREADYRYNLLPDGGMPFRLQLPIGTGPWDFRPCCDGQFGGIMKVYRDWKICGDDEWLISIWPAVKASLEYAWSPHNPDRWDPDKSGVLTGRQHHTLDMELFGPNSWLTGFYLGALKAAAEMADHLGETDSAAQYLDIFERGKGWVDENLFTGEYYTQRIDLGDREIVAAFEGEDDTLKGGTALMAYWDDEHSEIKYQIGEGSSIDQVLPQWHANLYGLGDLYDPVQVRQASAAIFKYNFIPEMGAVYNPCRIYCLNDEGGLVICAWPEGAQKPTIPAPYSQETMNGFEYAAAIHMIQNGMIEEGMIAIEAIRDRYDGERRNPWNEFECGSNYARSMASYALLNAFAGFEFDMVRRRIGFDPIQLVDGRFRTFWSLDSGWGEFVMEPGHMELRVLYGNLDVETLGLPGIAGQAAESVSIGEHAVEFEQTDGEIRLKRIVRVEPDKPLVVGL
jgi:non-lysosomal glucosylceramidase